MKKVAVIGHFAFGKEYLDGQTVKTKILAEELIRRFGENEVSRIDTHGGLKAVPKVLLKCIGALAKHENVVFLPAQNGVKIIAPWLKLFNSVFRRKLHYAVIGGWLPTYLKGKKRLEKILKKLDGIYVETTSMKDALREMGFENIVVMPNCKKLDVLEEDELVYPDGEPYKLCTFSRVMREKGIEDAVNAVKAVNDKFGRTVYTLDIYGQVDGGQTEWFEKLRESFPEYVTYGGLVPFDKSVEVLKNYFALLFPTRFYTEGIPGTLIDAYAAGVPVITALWLNSADIFDEALCGIGYEFGSYEGLCDSLIKAFSDPQSFLEKKKSCLRFSHEYLPENVVSALCERF